jgi:hypothetical protein
MEDQKRRRKQVLESLPAWTIMRDEKCTGSAWNYSTTSIKEKAFLHWNKAHTLYSNEEKNQEHLLPKHKMQCCAHTASFKNGTVNNDH